MALKNERNQRVVLKHVPTKVNRKEMINEISKTCEKYGKLEGINVKGRVMFITFIKSSDAKLFMKYNNFMYWNGYKMHLEWYKIRDENKVGKVLIALDSRGKDDNSDDEVQYLRTEKWGQIL